MDACEVEIFPEIAPDWLDSAAFKLIYNQHGGSGLGLSLSDVEGMSVRRIRWWMDRLDDVRQDEADAITKAQSE